MGLSLPGESCETAESGSPHERRTLIDIVFEKVVRHVDAQIKHCARCHTETRARFPHEMPGPLQYGSGIKAYVVHLLIAQMLSVKRVAQSVHALIGQLLSEATLLGYLAQLHHALAEWEHHAIERLLAMPASRGNRETTTASLTTTPSLYLKQMSCLKKGQLGRQFM